MGKVKGIMQERTLNLGDLKYVQIHDLDDSFSNSGFIVLMIFDYK